ncbi:MAG: DNA translocase FtsK 4TM domain-containing protein [Xanthomonadales bacterium]|nr:DNA translocase FtsK 4TM domain-containing protein [Xanthomonadales bacterium]
MAQHLVLRLRESAFIVLTPLAIYVLISLVTYEQSDPGWSHSGTAESVRNAGGVVGAWIADVGLLLFGYLAFLFPVMLAWWGWLILRGARDENRQRAEFLIRLAGFFVTLAAGASLAYLHFSAGNPMMPAGGGGVLGQFFGDVLSRIIGFMGATLILLALFLAGITLFTGLSWLGVMDATGALSLNGWHWLLTRREVISEWLAGRRARKTRTEIRRADSKRRRKQPPRKIKPEATVEKSTRARKEKQLPLFSSIPAGELPPLSLLDDPPEQHAGYSRETLEALARQVELKLADFKIEVQVVEVFPGPVITRFELLPAPGIKGSQISNLAKDIARGLSVISVRVVDVIPGKSVIGLEIPNANRETVYLSEILRSKAYDDSGSPMTLGLGKDISGKPAVANLARMPHLLVAGTTGSGKSVALNAMILSILYKATPEQVRMLMIDPKMLELSVYEGTPHLLAPVVTDMKEASNALRWCVAEMERRYKLMAALGVRNLAGFNKKIRDAAKGGKALKDPLWEPEHPGQAGEAPELQALPFIVVVIDEFADMMMIVGKKVEELIARLAQKARASGIHLVLATQRPSVDVITGLIKANIPTRIAFQVSSRVDSRTILDQTGAEQLLGHGDMLFLPPGTASPERIHGAFVDDHEVHHVVEYLKSHGEPEYLDEVLNETQVTTDGQQIGATGLLESAEDQVDELYDKAVFIVTQSRRASISNVQRRLRIGYNRAARLIEEMENAGIVSPPEHNGNREVLAPPPPEDS